MKKLWPYFIYFFLTMAVTLPLFINSGFVFLLDSSWAPSLDLADSMRDGITSSLPLTTIIKLFSYIIPLDIFHKIILSLIIFLPGVLMYRLARGFMKEHWAFVSGLIYMLNPWVLERFASGQWLVSIGYAFMPILIKLYIELLAHPSKKTFLKFVAMFGVYPLLSLHFAYIGGGLLVAMTVVHLFIHRKAHHSRYYFSFIKYAVLAVGIFLVVNMFWILDFNNPQSTVPRITFDDFRAYQTMSDSELGPYFNVASLYGFWNQEVVLPKDINPYWWANTLVIIFFSIFGMYYLVHKRSPLGITLAIIYIPILVASVGLASGLGEDFVTYLYNNVPMFKGLRDTQKLAGILALTYALFAPLGAHLLSLIVDDLKKDYGKIFKRTMFAILVFVPVASTFTIFSGVSGYMPVNPYPAGWYEANELLMSDSDSGRVLVLPWRGYMNMSFADMHVISSPAQRFFRNTLVASRSEGNDNLIESHNSAWDQKVFQIVQGFETIDQNIEFMKGEGITHIMLLREADFGRYEALLDTQQGIQKVLDSERLVLFELK